MAASPSDEVVARAFGGTIVRSATLPGPASYDDLQRRFVFLPVLGDGAAYALDVERRGALIPAEIVRELGARSCSEAAHLWTECEIQAKLLSVPVLWLLRRRSTCCVSVMIERADNLGHWIAVGRRT